MRPTDIAGRFGGEEFVAIVSGQDSDAALVVANRVREVFQSAARYVDGADVGATVSVGVDIHGDRHGTEPAGFAALLAAADTALYRAKQTGRNRVVLAGREDAAAGSAGAHLFS